MEKVIGTNQISYPQIRNFVDLPHGYTFVEERDFFTTFLNQYFRVTKKVHPFFQFLHYNPLQSKIKLRHFFNTISFNNTPFIVTFETTIPRLGNAPKWFYDKAIESLASKYCKKVIAISQNAYDFQINYLKENYPTYLTVIQSKMVTIHPPQKLLINNYSEKRLPDDKIIFTIVGIDFFRKGGGEVLNVFDQLLKNNKSIQLNIVSSMNYGDYASKTTIDDLNRALEIIGTYPDNIKHFNSLTNSQVEELFKNTHIGLLPTWGDTYGYSVLEAQAAGCPVISTDLRALQEINNNDIGWIINIPKLSTGNADIATEEKRIEFQNILELKLERIICDIICKPKQIRQKGEKSLDNVQLNHSPQKNAKVLNRIYENARV